MFLRTERLFLRPPFPEDWRAIYRGVGDEDMVQIGRASCRERV